MRASVCVRVQMSADLFGIFAGQEGGVRGVLGGGPNRGVHPQGVRVTSTLRTVICACFNLCCPKFCDLCEELIIDSTPCRCMILEYIKANWCSSQQS